MMQSNYICVILQVKRKKLLILTVFTWFLIGKGLNPGVISKVRSLIFRVNIVLNRTVVVDSDWRFDNICSSRLQSQSELYLWLLNWLVNYAAMLLVVCQLSLMLLAMKTRN